MTVVMALVGMTMGVRVPEDQYAKKVHEKADHRHRLREKSILLNLGLLMKKLDKKL